MKKTVIAFLSAPLSCLSAFASEPMIIFSDTFDDLSRWSAPSNPSETRIIEVTAVNSESLFGEADNSYLRIFKADSETGNNVISANNVFTEPSPVVTIAFDFWNSSVGGGQLFLRPGGTSSNNANRVHEIGFARGSLSGVSNVYQVEQTHRIEIILNNSIETVIYNDFYSVASDTFDVWIDGVRVLNDSIRSRGSLPVGEALASMQMGVFTTNWGELLIDNLVVYAGAHATPASETPVPVFVDTFDTFDAWGAPTNQLEGHRLIEVTDENSGVYFGEANNNYLRFFKDDPEDNTASMLTTAINVISSPVVTVSFDFWENTAEGLDVGFAFRAGQGTSVPNAARVHNLTLRNGAINDNIGLYQPNQLNNLQIVYNNSAQSVTYLAGMEQLNSDAMDVWLNGVLVLKNEQFGRGSLAVGEPIRSFQFVGFPNDRAEFFIDDFQAYDTAFVLDAVVDPALPNVMITGFEHAEESFNLSFTSNVGFNYTVEFKDSLMSIDWQPLITVPGTGDILTAMDWGVPGLAARFYRVSVSAE